MDGVRANPLELSLSLKPFYVPKTLADLLKDLRNIDDTWAKLSLLDEYLQQHKQELARVEPFRRDLPQSTLLLLESINILEKEIEKVKNKESESKRPLVEIPTEKIRRTNEEEERLVLENRGEKPPASSAAFLCSLDHYLDSAPAIQPCKFRGKERGEETANGSGRSPLPLKTRIPRAENGHGRLNLEASDPTLDHGAKPLSKPICKKNRRTWTWELHARFLGALNFLGGPEVATPKQIREVMQVEGLTNNQVKSHLQKYRLYYQILESQATRRTDSEVAKDLARFQCLYPLQR